ncbi:MAG: hypothetical protein M3437_01390 [Chloroflexota bacterium]|nr:hypothetical protein [Chloroflexota bacterium]MDQ5867411.1 hypothetical protein [Chloroflexota bacterium]
MYDGGNFGGGDDFGLTFGPQIPDPLDDLVHDPWLPADPVDDFLRKHHPVYPLSNEYQKDQQELMAQDMYLRQRQEYPSSTYTTSPVQPTPSYQQPATEHLRRLRLVSSPTDHMQKMFSVHDVILTPDGRTALISCSIMKESQYHLPDHPSLYVYDLQSERQRCTLDIGDQYATRLAVTPDGTRLVAGYFWGVVRVWDIATQTLLHTLKGHHTGVHRIIVSPDGRRALTAANDGQIFMWDIVKGNMVYGMNTARPGEFKRKMPFHHIRGMAVTPDWKLGLVSECLGDIFVLDLQQQTLLYRVKIDGEGDKAYILALAVLDDGHHFVSADSKGNIGLWDLRSQKLERIIGTHSKGNAEHLSIVPGEKYVVSCSGSGEICAWELSSSKCTSRFNTSTHLGSCSISRDGRTMITGGYADDMARVYILRLE